MERQVHQTTELDGENIGVRPQGDGSKHCPTEVLAVGARVARTPDRTPMIQLSPNATQLSTKSGPSNLALRARVPEVSREAVSAYNLGGSTTHRGNHPSASSPWHLGSGSGSMTARGKTRQIFSYDTNESVL